MFDNQKLLVLRKELLVVHKLILEMRIFLIVGTVFLVVGEQKGVCFTLIKLLSLWVVVIVLSGCTGQLAYGSLSITVANSSESFTGVTTCGGGLRAKVSLRSGVVFDGTATNNGVLKNDSVDQQGTVTVNEREIWQDLYEGYPVFIEAWCYDADSSELGYVEIQSTLKYNRNDNGIFINVPNFPKVNTTVSCVKPFSQRGQPPCITSTIIE
jgi:hypothetical protein